MPKIISAAVAALAIMLCLTGYSQVPEEIPFELSSRSALLMDAGSGQIIAQKNADEKTPIAGVAKVMTALLVFEEIDAGRLKLDEAIQISSNAASTTGTQAYLDANASYKISDLVRSMCVASANDSAVALAEKIAGSHEVFVQRMNERAAQLGAVNTNFSSCTGHMSDDTVSTACDLALIARELLKHRSVLKYTSIYMDTLTHPDGRVTELVNANRLVRFYQNCDGLFTGSSTSAIYCAVVTAQRGEQRLISVTLAAQNSTSRFEDCKTIMDYGFANFTVRLVVKKGEILHKNYTIPGGKPNKINIAAAEDLRITIRKGEENKLRKELVINSNIPLPISAGSEVGTLNVYLDDKLLACVPAVTSASVKEMTIWECIRTILRYWVMG